MDEMPLRAGKKKSTNLMQQQASNSSKPSTRFESTIRMKELPNSVTLTSESDDEEQDDEGKLIMRKVSTQRQLQSKACIKEGYLQKQASMSFQRSRSRYFKLRPRRLYFAKHENSEIFDELDLTDSSVAEKSTKKVNCTFSIIGPNYNIILCAESRKEMDEWISAIKAVQAREFYSPHQVYMDNFSDGHNWYAYTHNRPTYCNVCREVLSGVMNHGLSCDVCKFKAHKRCAAKATNGCKWTTLATVGKHVIEDEDGLWIPHQWLEGNLPVSAKCVVCDKTCGSVLRMQDWRCLWCRSVVHTSCKSQLGVKCPIGSCKLSIVPPTAINSDSDDYWQAVPSSNCTSPLLVFVNSKSGDNQGVKFLRRFRQFLNPAQVFDLMCSGPQIGLQMFRKFDMFRILICGGDGSVGWVLSEMDKLKLSSKAQVGVLPLGTGNDLAQVMGWGNMCDDDTQVPSIIERYERASAKLLDRWSVLTYEGKLPLTIPTVVDEALDHKVLQLPMTQYEHTVADHLSTILNSDKTSKVVNSASVLCETVKDFVAKVGQEKSGDDELPLKCQKLEEKLASLINTLSTERRLAELEQQREEEGIVLPCSVPSCDAESSMRDKSVADRMEVENVSKILEDLPLSLPLDAARDQIPGVVLTTDDSSSNEITLSKSGATKEAEDIVRKDKLMKRTKVFEQRSQLMLRANSLKKAVRQIIEYAENALDDQNHPGLQKKLSVPYEEEESVPLVKTSFVDSQQEDVTSAAKEALKIDTSPSLLLPPTARPMSKSAPSTPTTIHEAPMFEKYTRQSSVSPNPTRASAATRREGLSSHSIREISSFSQKKSFSTPINPLYSAHSRNSFLSRVLLANADALCAPATPLLQTDDSVFNSLFSEKCVMNNYIGIGLDAKITLDFHRKREENPKKCSRTKNRVWYGMLATKEFAVKTYKNLEQRIKLECDGHHIPLPALQGIVVLNIPSYAGGANFWGSKSANEIFLAPSYNDKVLEVVAVFSTVQLGMAIVVPDGVLQQHRIAQCRSVKITILGDEPVPMQTDGEAWLQPPGIVKIKHKNRVQMLARDRRLEVALKSWEEKQWDRSQQSNFELLTDNEVFMVGQIAETATAIAASVNESIGDDVSLKEELLPSVSTLLRLNVKLRPQGRVTKMAGHHLVAEFVVVVLDLEAQLDAILSRRAQDLGHDLAEKFDNWIGWLRREIKKIKQIKWLSQVEQNNAEFAESIPHSSKQMNRNSSGMFKIFKKSSSKKEKTSLDSDASSWSSDEVVSWLDLHHLQDCKEAFIRNDVQGRQLVKLEASKLKDLGVTKPEQIKRVLSAVKELHDPSNH
ncbi:diacylglycerol kinase delta-like isoform X2 [Clavelina lepadiformis]|uniref:diacylglycerol kinase delta-like isoform X2 n=1 Tax=Clavelina lepadiformis TaxID=159417 RepID=UPI00404134AD